MEIADTGQRESIREDDEYFLEAADRSDLCCPQLKRIFRDFYADPKIFPNHAGSIVEELDLLKSLAFSKHSDFNFPDSWPKTHARLRHFFGEADRLGSMIYCRSD